MKKLIKFVILIMFCFLLTTGVFTLFIKTNTYKSNAGAYQYAHSKAVSLNYQNQYLNLRAVSTTADLNKDGLVHIGKIIQYQNQSMVALAEVKDYEGTTLILVDGNKINANEVLMVGQKTNDLILLTTNILVENQTNFIIVVILFSGIVTYYILSLTTKKNSGRVNAIQSATTNVSTPSQPVLIDPNYSDVDKMGLDFINIKAITFTKDDFNLNLNTLTVEQVTAYCEAKPNTIKTPGTGKNPTSLKVNGKKSFLLIYQNDQTIKLTFKCSPIIGEELIKMSNHLVIRSSFPHGSVWFSILDSTTTTEQTLKNLIDLAYHLAAKSV